MNQGVRAKSTTLSFHHGHEIWATVSGDSLDDIKAQTATLLAFGVHAIEIRLDLIPESIWDPVLYLEDLAIPKWIAHFGVDRESTKAEKAISLAVQTSADGCICHSRVSCIAQIRALCESTHKMFAAPYHSQSPLTVSEALKEYDYQESLSPMFRKIAVRANTSAEALAIIQATQQKAASGTGTPVVGAIFGPHRWARIALPNIGSAITFVIAKQVINEVGGNDEQLQVQELAKLFQVRNLFPGCRAAANGGSWKWGF